MFFDHAHFSDTVPPPPPAPPGITTKPKMRLSRIVLIVAVIVAIIIVAVVLAFVFVPKGAKRVSIEEASLGWEYNSVAQRYQVNSVTLKLTNNGKEQLFSLYVQVEGNWPVQYESERGFFTSVGAGLNAGETRTISASGWDLFFGTAWTSQAGTYTATLRVGTITPTSNIITGYQLADVYGECTITTTIEPHPTVSGTIADFPGLWINIDAATSGITQVEIQAVSNGLSIHPWGSCTPTDCDWGARTFQVNANPFTITWTESFCIRTQIYSHLSNGRLHIYCLTHYTDWSGRVDMEEDYYFQKTV